MIKIIAFGHRQRVGKDTAVKFAVAHLKTLGIRDAYRLSLFDKIKTISHQIYGWGGLEDGIYYENHPEKKDSVLAPIGKSPRQIWIDLGEELYRICPATLCQLAFQGLKDGVYFISDLRRPIEAEFVRQAGGYNIRIDRDSVDRSSDVVDCSLDGYDGWHDAIDNNGTLKEYIIKVTTLVERLLK